MSASGPSRLKNNLLVTHHMTPFEPLQITSSFVRYNAEFITLLVR